MGSIWQHREQARTASLQTLVAAVEAKVHRLRWENEALRSDVADLWAREGKDVAHRQSAAELAASTEVLVQRLAASVGQSVVRAAAPSEWRAEELGADNAVLKELASSCAEAMDEADLACSNADRAREASTKTAHRALEAQAAYGSVRTALGGQDEAPEDNIQSMAATRCEISALALVDELLAELESLQHRADVAIRQRSVAAGNAQVLVGQAWEQARTLQAEVEATQQRAEVGVRAATQACMLKAERDRLRKSCAAEGSVAKAGSPSGATAAVRAAGLIQEVPEDTATTHQRWTGPISLSTFLTAAPEERRAARLAAGVAVTDSRARMWDP
mmetsp:Transcript_23486/g.58433  ORF Transcript_23486/g.58433 Transcript_23486/m.58433 type:complete len:332 (+) Transcript_23486:72-1067(+)